MASTPDFERVLPLLDDLNRPFWTGGDSGHLTVMQCQACTFLIHPPLPICPRCRARFPKPHALSGKGTVKTFTHNFQPWFPGLAVPYTVAIVELIEQPGLQLTSNIIHCAMEQVSIGMEVQVRFERHEDVWLPLFEPDLSSRPAPPAGATTAGKPRI